MFRRRSVGKARMEPEVCILLRNIARYPGDVMQGVVIVDLAVPVDILTLELRLAGDERATIGGFLITDKNPEARKTVYYEQFVTLRGVDHDALEQRRGLLGRRRTVVSQDTLMRQSASNAASLSNQGGASSSDAPSGNNSIADLSPSVASGSAAGSVHLVPGTYSFPFKVTLPDALPPSRELYRAREGIVTLRYHATATMILVGGKVHSAEAPFAVNPLPVQMQRWFQLHGDEQNGMEASEAEDGVAADLGSSAVDGASSRVGFKSRLMSSPGTISADAADKEREVMCQRRIRHYRQFPEQQLAVERAEYERRAAAEGGEDAEGGAGNGRGRDSPSSPLQRNDTAITTGTAAAAAAGESESSPRTRPRTYRERRAQQDAADNRSLDGAGDQDKAFAAAEPEEGEEEDAVRAFGGEQSGTETPTPPPTADGDPLSGGDTGNGAVEAKRKKKHRHHGKAAAEGSALVENAVDQLAFTPPEEDLAPAPAHLRVRHSTDATAASAQQPSRRKSRDAKAAKKGGNDNDTNSGGEEGREKSLSTQAHKRRSRFVPPPWHQEFSINLRGGFLRSGKVKVKLSLRSPLVSIGYGNVAVKLLVDNSDGGGTITKLKYSLVTRCYIRTKTEVYNYHVDSVETITDVNIEKGTVVVVPEVEVPVPKSTPLTMLTEGMGTLTFLNVRFYVGTALKTFSKSVETEVVMVSGQDSQNNSRRLLRWTCFYRRRSNEDTRELTLRPPTVNLSEQNAKVCVVKASELACPAGSPMAGGGEADTSSMAPSVMSRSQQLMRHSRRIAKDAPSIDNRRLASVLKYDTAIFVPPADDDDAAMPPSHVDPMSMLNPFAMPPPNMVSSLPSPELNDKEL